MSSCYFAQYLLNTGFLEEDQLLPLLYRAADAVPGTALLALSQGLMTAAQVASVDCADDETFAVRAQERGLLTKSQLMNMHQAAPGRDVRFAQVLLDSQLMDYAQLEEAFHKCETAEPNPVTAAVHMVKIEEIRQDMAFYGEYVDAFFRSLLRFMDTDAVVLPENTLLHVAEETYAVSQRLSGDLNIAAGIMAEERVFLEMARRYSHEEIHEVDELAVDSIAEFLNVMNGLFVVNLSKREMDIDLEMPRSACNIRPDGSHQLMLRVFTDFGSFLLVLATDEFLY